MLQGGLAGKMLAAEVLLNRHELRVSRETLMWQTPAMRSSLTRDLAKCGSPVPDDLRRPLTLSVSE
jgi:hypothetical protein